MDFAGGGYSPAGYVKTAEDRGPSVPVRALLDPLAEEGDFLVAQRR